LIEKEEKNATGVLKNILDPLQLGNLYLKNRLVALPIFTGYAHPDGRVSSLLINHYSQLAGSGVAMVVVANATVAADGITSSYSLRNNLLNQVLPSPSGLMSQAM